MHDDNGLTVTLPLQSVGNDVSENWLLLSKEPLFKNKKRSMNGLAKVLNITKKRTNGIQQKGLIQNFHGRSNRKQN